MEELAKQHFVEFHDMNSYWATDEQRHRAEVKEKAVRDFLLDRADMVRLTASPWIEFPTFNWNQLSLIKRHGDENDPRFQTMLENIKENLIEKYTNNERYQVEQGSHNRFNHYLYRLSPRMKDLLNETSLLWYRAINENIPFYSFEDPTFYKNKELVGYVISHEDIAILNITSSERRLLEQQGVDFDPTMEDLKQRRNK